MLLPHTIYTQLLAMMPHACSLLIAADALDDDVMMISYIILCPVDTFVSYIKT